MYAYYDNDFRVYFVLIITANYLIIMRIKMLLSSENESLLPNCIDLGHILVEIQESQISLPNDVLQIILLNFYIQVSKKYFQIALFLGRNFVESRSK